MDKLSNSIFNFATETLSKSAARFLNVIFLKWLGKSYAQSKAEAENVYDAVRHEGEIARQVREPILIQLEQEKLYRQYTNLGDTLRKATPLITAPESKIEDDNDVFWNLLEHAKDISNEEVQTLISKILAGEYNKPGTYTMSTLQILKMLGKDDLESFERIAGLRIHNVMIPVDFFGFLYDAPAVRREYGLGYDSLQALQSLGLILSNSITNQIPNPDDNEYQVQYFDKVWTFVLENKDLEHTQIPSYYQLSIAGNQIIQHLSPKYNEVYYQWLLKHYRWPNYKVK